MMKNKTLVLSLCMAIMPVSAVAAGIEGLNVLNDKDAAAYAKSGNDFGEYKSPKTGDSAVVGKYGNGTLLAFARGGPRVEEKESARFKSKPPEAQAVEAASEKPSMGWGRLISGLVCAAAAAACILVPPLALGAAVLVKPAIVLGVVAAFLLLPWDQKAKKE